MMKRLPACAALALACTSVCAQQLVPGMTGPDCAARGGSIRTWTSSMDVQPPRGECWIPPRIGGAGAAAAGRGGAPGAPGSALGAAAGFAGALGNFIDQMNQMEADRQAREQAEQEALRAERRQWEQQNIERQGALMQREAERRAQERQQAANPFAADAPGGADLDKCREGSNAPWTIAGCYDLKGKGAAPNEEESLRDRLARSLSGSGEPKPAENPFAATPAPAAVPQAPQAAPLAAQGAPQDPWSNGPWRSNDDSACRALGGVLVKPNTPGDMTGIPQVLLDNPSVSREQLAATPYCMDNRVGRVAPLR